MVESSIDNSKTPAALLHKLCCRLLGDDSDSIGTVEKSIQFFDPSK